MNTILVTGGAGFLGSWFVREWLATEGGRVVVLDKLTYAGNRRSLDEVCDDSRFVFRRGDIGDRRLVSSLLREFTPSAVVNFAAETHVDRSIDSPAPFVDTNVVGTSQFLEATYAYWRSLAEAARQQFRLLHISTDEVFGPVDSPHQVAESAPYRPSSPYAASKAGADHFVLAYHHTYQLPVLIAHPTNCYGPYQFPEKLIPLVTLNAIEARRIPIYGSGSQQRDWLWGGDLCKALRIVLAKGGLGESYNISANAQTTNLALAKQICDLVDEQLPNLPHVPTRSLVTHVEDRPGHDIRYALDSAKLHRFGWQPSMDLSDGLRHTVAWYIANRAWVSDVASDFDRTRRLGLSSR